MKYHPSEAIRVLVIWEKILPTDYSLPGTAVLARLPDPRAAQYWDEGLLLSRAAQPVLAANPSRITGKTELVTGKAVWDFIAVYRPGAKWDRQFPLPDFGGGPVADVAMQLSDTLPR